jgi:hypothetical protein
MHVDLIPLDLKSSPRIWIPIQGNIDCRYPYCLPVLRIRIRIHRIHVFLGLLHPDPLVRGMGPDPVVRGMDPGMGPDPVVRGMEPDPAPDPFIIKQK